MNEQRLTGAIGIFVVAFILGCLAGWYFKPAHKCAPCPGMSASIENKIDTLTLKIPHEPINVKGQARVHYKRNEVLTQEKERFGPVWSIPLPFPEQDTADFTATLDTIVNRDTFAIKYHSARAEFEFSLRQAPDSIQYVQRTTLITQVQYEQTPWWKFVACAVIGGAVGYGVGR